MNENIIPFIQQQSCATVCYTDEAGVPFCFSCYYVFNEQEVLLYFKTSADSHHSVMMKKNPRIAGTVLPDKLNKIATRGIQFRGELLDAHDTLCTDAYSNYHKKIPMALAMKGEVLTIRMDSIKMTDSTKIFGKKTTWERQESIPQ